MFLDERPLDTLHLRTGFVPDESDSKPIKAAIAAHREAMLAIDVRIADLQKNRQDISEKMAFNEAFLAPVRRLAPEILCKIFVHCVPPEPTNNHTLPLSLRSVCHIWRNMVQEIPEVWSQIYVNSRTRLSLVEMFLRNSTTVPLDVTLSLWDPIGDNANQADGHIGDPWDAVEDQAMIVMERKEIVRVISEQHRRIRRLSLHAPYSILETFFPSRFITKTSLLEDLTINCPDVLLIGSRFRLKGGRLRSLNIDGKTFITTSINRTFGLRRVSLQGTVPVAKLLQFLRVSPALEELRMENFQPRRNDRPNGTNGPVILTKLSLLEITWAADDYSPLEEFPISYIRTPAVTSLFLKFSRIRRGLNDLYDLLTSAAKSLVRLSLERLHGHSFQFFQMIEGLSALEVLYIRDLSFTGMWDIFKDGISNSWVCPKLTNLELCKVDVDERFLEFVRRRTRLLQSETIQDGFHYLRSVVISQQYVSSDVSTSLGNLEREREDFFVELRDCREER